MICEKCGCEHNSRSVCPKCGAAVIYVNDDYLRRKQEWEFGKTGTGTVTETEENRTVRRKGFSEMISLSFAAFKKKIIKLIALIIVFAGRIKDKRNRKKLIAAVAAAATAVIVAVSIVLITKSVRNRDDSEVFYYDGHYGYFAVNEKLFGEENGMKYVRVRENGYIFTGKNNFIIFDAGEITVVEADEPQIIACSNSMTSVIYAEKDRYLMYDGKISEISCTAAPEYIKDCVISENGQYFALVTVTSDADEYICSIYYGTPDGMTEISRNGSQGNIFALTDGGQLLYMDMDTAEYGIVNDRSIKLYDGTSVRTIAEKITDYRYIDGQTRIVYTDTDKKMYEYSDGTLKLLDENVNELYDNAACDTMMFYEKDDGYYIADTETDTTVPIFSTDIPVTSIYYMDGYLYFTSGNGLYGGKAGMTDRICTMGKKTELMWYSGEKCFLTVDADGRLLRLTDETYCIKNNAEYVIPIENCDGFMYEADGIKYIAGGTEDRPKKAEFAEISADAEKIIYSQKYYYCHDTYGYLWRIDKKCNNAERISNAELCIFVE